MIAYKFLAKGALEPLSGCAWPISGQEAQVCRAEDLAHWLHEELWVLETEGAQRSSIDCLVVERARLVRRIDAWQLGDALRFALACAAYASTLADRVHAAAATTVRDYIEDALASGQAGYIGVSAHAAALAVTLASVELGIESSEEGAYRTERARQSAWIAQYVILPNAAL
ncbi:MAG TPA: hypothetical protein VHW01_24560 [Polyangiaceae bacterium]|nr:hypothetical protein [Polyangiaceae bacterium]